MGEEEAERLSDRLSGGLGEEEEAEEDKKGASSDNELALIIKKEYDDLTVQQASVTIQKLTRYFYFL